MAELSQAYGYGDNDSFAPQNDYYEDSRNTSGSHGGSHGGSRGGHEKQEMQRDVPHVSNNSQQIVQPPPMAPEFTPQTQRRQVSINPSYSFGDRMTMKRGEVIKLAMFSLVIVMATSTPSAPKVNKPAWSLSPSPALAPTFCGHTIFNSFDHAWPAQKNGVARHSG